MRDTIDDTRFALYDQDLDALEAGKTHWAQTDAATRVEILRDIKDRLSQVAEGWAETAARKKRIPQGSPLVGEEWLTGPYALMSFCDALIGTLSKLEGKRFLDPLPIRPLPSGQTAVQVFPSTVWERLLISGVRAEVWMEPGITKAQVPHHAAVAYDEPTAKRRGKVALVLGAGNIAAISPLDAFQKLFLENQVVLLKMNPVNDYLTDYLEAALDLLVRRDALRIRRGDGAVGAYLTTHPLVEEIHITGARATHDKIVWGDGAERPDTPVNPRHVTSELGAVCPTIVVPGPWSKADIRFQAEHLATMKLHNGCYNCVAMQALILPGGWPLGADLMSAFRDILKDNRREAYYPGTEDRLAAFKGAAGATKSVPRGKGVPPVEIATLATGAAEALTQDEVFAPALSVKSLPAANAEAYLREAIAWANDNLYGTLGANILIHPATLRQIGQKRFEELLADLRYGVIAVNAWTGVAFTLPQIPWGGHSGATLDNVESGIGTVHNSFLLEHTQKTVMYGPWRPFPRSLWAGKLDLLPRPPWFVTNRRQHVIGRLLLKFQRKRSLLTLIRIFMNALRG